MTRENRHELKCWPEFFQASWVGDKIFEIRVNDRGFQERDEIVLCEWDPITTEYTGRQIHGFIRYITPLLAVCSEDMNKNCVVFQLDGISKEE